MTDSNFKPYEQLPGWELIHPGLADAAVGRLSPESCLVWIAAPRLRSVGILGGEGKEILEPERKLYALLRQHGGDAYPTYQSLLRRLARFVRALPSVSRFPNESFTTKAPGHED